MRTRLITAAVVVAGVVLGDASAALGQVETKRSRVRFELTAETCPKLPAGAVVTGSGGQTSVTTTTTDSSGVKTVVNYTRAKGAARSETGVRYRFDYQNSLVVSNALAPAGQYIGTMYDLFELVRVGRTRPRLSNGFVAAYTTDLDKVNLFSELYSFGDPIDFATGKPHCDPL